MVAHNLDRLAEKAAIAIDNIRVAICDLRSQNDTHFDSREPHYSSVKENSKDNDLSSNLITKSNSPSTYENNSK